MFINDNVVENDRRMLHVNELESKTLPDVSTQALCPAARDAFVIFEDFFLLGNGDCPQLFRKVCLFSPLPLLDPYASSYPQITVMFAAFRVLNLITTPPFPPAPQNALRALRFPACPPWHPCCLPLAQAIILR